MAARATRGRHMATSGFAAVTHTIDFSGALRLTNVRKANMDARQYLANWLALVLHDWTLARERS